MSSDSYCYIAHSVGYSISYLVLQLQNLANLSFYNIPIFCSLRKKNYPARPVEILEVKHFRYSTKRDLGLFLKKIPMTYTTMV